MTEPILGFFGPYRFLSNFEYADIWMEGAVYPTTEHAYQAAKTLNEDERELIRTCGAPKFAKRYGSQVKMRRDWDSVKVAYMYLVNTQKYQHAHLRMKLLDTADAYLEETNTWGDTFWGVCNGVGRNELGKLLMQIRDEIKQLIQAPVTYTNGKVNGLKIRVFMGSNPIWGTKIPKAYNTQVGKRLGVDGS